nr:synaptobrevin, longin-like domain protein [Tanacetum cinerariifolium]
MVDFIEASPLRYALTVKPTVYVSHIRQFWSTTRIETTEEGTKILATVNGIVRTVSESSLRRNLKLRDEEGISSLPDTELFENLTLMGYNISPNQKFTFQKGQLSHQWKYLIHTIMQCIIPKSTGFNEFSRNISTALVCLTTNRTYNFSKMIFDGLVKNVNNKISKFLMYPRDISQGEACPTDSGFIANQDRTTIAKSSTLPHDSAPRVPSPAAVESSMQQTILELTALCTSLQRQLSELTDIFQAQESMDEREAATERIVDDTEEMATVLASIDAAIILASGVVDISTGSGSILTASTPVEEQVPTGSDVVPTASPVFATATVVTTYRRRKGKEIMVESETSKNQKAQEQIDAQVAREVEEQLEREDQRRSEQISRDAEIEKIHVEEELQMMIDGLDRNNKTSQKNKPRTKKQKMDYYMAVIRNNLGCKVKDFKGMTFKEVETKFKIVWEQIKGGVTKISKEEAAWIKRKGIRLDQEEVKKMKTSEEVPEEVKSSEEVSEENIKEMIQLVPIEEITRLGGSSASYQFFTDLLKHLDRDDLNQVWILVKSASCNIQGQRNLHASGEGLPSKEGLALVMISYKLQVENYSQIANDLVLKIYKVANSPRQKGRIVGNKMHKAFPLLVIEFPLAEQLPTASEERCHY